jgi:hypothetical protein
MVRASRWVNVSSALVCRFFLNILLTYRQLETTIIKNAITTNNNCENSGLVDLIFPNKERIKAIKYSFPYKFPSLLAHHYI